MCALGHELEADGIVVVRRVIRPLALGRFLPKIQVLSDASLAAGEGDEAESVGQDFVLDDRGVVIDEDGIDGEGGDLGDEDATEGVGYRGINADEGELGVELFVLVPLNLEALTESIFVPCVIFVRIVIRVIG